MEDCDAILNPNSKFTYHERKKKKRKKWERSKAKENLKTTQNLKSQTRRSCPKFKFRQFRNRSKLEIQNTLRVYDEEG